MHVDRLHARVRRLEADAVALGVVALHRRLALDHHHHDVAGVGALALAHEDVVAVEDAVLDHRLADDLEREDLAPVAEQHASRRPRCPRLLLGEDGLARGDAAEDGHCARRPAARPTDRRRRSPSPLLGRVSVSTTLLGSA